MKSYLLEDENEKFSKRTFLKRIVKIPYGDELFNQGTFAQIWQKYGCSAYELKGEHELIRINYENLVNKSFEGSCIIEVRDQYYDARKAIVLSVQEIIVKGLTFPCKAVCNTDLTSESEEESEEELGGELGGELEEESGGESEERLGGESEEVLQTLKFAMPKNI